MNSYSPEGNLESIEVHHFGPGGARVGGIERVIGIMVDYKVGADCAVRHSTMAKRTIVGFPFGLLRTGLEVLRLRRGVVAHVHLSHRGSFLREGAVLILAHARRIACVATIHGSTFTDFADAHPRVVALVLRRTDVVTCLSNDARDVIRRLAPSTVVEMVPNPIPADPESYSASETTESILLAGELSERKGVDVLCRAWPLILARRPKATCMLVGRRTPLAIPRLEQMTIKAPVEFKGIRKLIREARVVVLPSRNEGMPMILTEALSAGRPFVSTPVGGIPELANGIQPLVEVGDHVELANRIVELLEDPQLAADLGDRGRAFHAETRSIEAVGMILRPLYDMALSNRENL